MAFLPTVALFLAVAVAEEAATDTVDPAEGELAESEEELAEEGETMEDDMTDEEEADEEDAAEAFAKCARHTTWAEEDASQGNTLDGATCEVVHPADCLTHPDINGCCPEKCNKELICADFESQEGPKLVECLNKHRYRGGNHLFDMMNPNYWSMFDWKAGVVCSDLLEMPEATGKNSEINLCCNASTAARRLADEAEAGVDDAVDAETADDDAETDDAVDAEPADAGDKASEDMYPTYVGEKLRSMMCNGASTTTTNSESPIGDAETETSSGESTDGTDATATGTNSSASTFGFTALALMLVTA